jgi:hypothetical protein
MLNLTALFSAIVAIESGGDVNAVGDGGKAVGPAQIWTVVVTDCNRISGKHFEDKDRRSFTKSAEMFQIYTEHYGKKYGVPVTDEVRAKVWNGGPNGPKKQATEKYWQKVKAKLSRA